MMAKCLGALPPLKTKLLSLALDRAKHYKVVTRKMIRDLQLTDKDFVKAGLMGAKKGESLSRKGPKKFGNTHDIFQINKKHIPEFLNSARVSFLKNTLGFKISEF
jgi:hypothetical protein